MNRNKRAFNVFNNEMPFLLPQPIPEPPRVINPRPMVPDVSITSEVPVSGQPLHTNRDHFDKYRTLYPSPPKPQPPADYYCQQAISGQPLRQLTTNLPTNVKTNDRFSERLVCNHLNGLNVEFNCVNDRNGFGFTEEKNPKNIFTNGRLKDDKPIDCKNSVKPKIIRHSTTTSDPVHNQCRTQPKSRTNEKKIQFSKPINTKNAMNSPTNEEMLELIRQQDIQLQKISEQIEELLTIHRICDNSDRNVRNCMNNKRSVQTMTSIVMDNNQNITPLSHKPRHQSTHRGKGSAKSTQSTPSTASKDLRALHLRTISECPSEPSDIELDSNRLNFSESPVRRRLGQSSSVERIRVNDSNESIDDRFYDQMINNIEVMLNNSTSDGTDADSGRRSSCSPTPPESRREPPHRKHQIQLQTEQTLYIKRLAAKYLMDDSTEYKTKPKHKMKQKCEQNYYQSVRTDLNVYGLTRNASIATKNYLEKYGLTHSPPKVQKSPNLFDNNNRNRNKLNRNKILDIESLKRQPKLT